ncbi:unnamed protein product [Nyctereutes procyonoides]|uniref:(raccoon dog) hypothetical protein n=1 Tax=Nyctereutes procyonoides TaxID=34880 RepID=A0A811Y6S0_NYCPR|nr:unnamed protein product [Nyctereutes procyonoides]
MRDIEREPVRTAALHPGIPPRQNYGSAAEPRLALDSRSPAVPAAGPRGAACAAARRDLGPVRRAPRPGKRGAARKGAAPSPVTQRTFVGNLVLNHS